MHISSPQAPLVEMSLNCNYCAHKSRRPYSVAVAVWRYNLIGTVCRSINGGNSIIKFSAPVDRNCFVRLKFRFAFLYLKRDVNTFVWDALATALQSTEYGAQGVTLYYEKRSFLALLRETRLFRCIKRRLHNNSCSSVFCQYRIILQSLCSVVGIFILFVYHNIRFTFHIG